MTRAKDVILEELSREEKRLAEAERKRDVGVAIQVTASRIAVLAGRASRNRRGEAMGRERIRHRRGG